MTNMELTHEVKKLNEKIDEQLKVIQRLGQKVVAYDQIYAALKEETDKSRVDINNLGRIVNDVVKKLAH